MNEVNYDYLIHYGVKGMKWGVRHDPKRNPRFSRSVKGTGYRMLAKVYGLNERTYNKTGNKALASMNKAAKNKYLKKAESVDRQKTNKQKKTFYNKHSKTIKRVAIGSAVVGGLAIGSIAVRNIRIKNEAKKEVMAALKRTGSKRISDVLKNHRDSFINNAEDAKFLNDKNLRDSAKIVSNYHKRQIEKIKSNADIIIDQHTKSVPKKEITKEASSLVKERKGIKKDNREIGRYNAQLYKQYKKGKIDYQQYKSMYKRLKNQKKYTTPPNWYKYYPKDWI